MILRISVSTLTANRSFSAFWASSAVSYATKAKPLGVNGLTEDYRERPVLSVGISMLLMRPNWMNASWRSSLVVEEVKFPICLESDKQIGTANNVFPWFLLWLPSSYSYTGLEPLEVRLRSEWPEELCETERALSRLIERFSSLSCEEWVLSGLSSMDRSDSMVVVWGSEATPTVLLPLRRVVIGAFSDHYLPDLKEEW